MILKNNRYISKKDLGLFVSDLLSKQKNLDADVRNFIAKKYALDNITGILKNSSKKAVSFREIRQMANISKRVFYLRLRIIKRYFMNLPNFNWVIRRGKFVRIG